MSIKFYKCVTIVLSVILLLLWVTALERDMLTRSEAHAIQSYPLPYPFKGYLPLVLKSAAGECFPLPAWVGYSEDDITRVYRRIECHKYEWAEWPYCDLEDLMGVLIGVNEVRVMAFVDGYARIQFSAPWGNEGWIWFCDLNFPVPDFYIEGEANLMATPVRGDNRRNLDGNGRH